MAVIADRRVPGGKGPLSSVDFKLCLWLPTTGARCRWLFMQFLILQIKDVGSGNCEQTDLCTPFRTALTGYQEAYLLLDMCFPYILVDSIEFSGTSYRLIVSCSYFQCSFLNLISVTYNKHRHWYGNAVRPCLNVCFPLHSPLLLRNCISCFP